MRRERRAGGRAGLAGLEEPTTVLTDWIMAAMAAYWAAALIAAGQGDGGAGAATVLWGAAFAATALSAALGGVVHGFQHRLGPGRSRPLWRATLHLITLASAAMLAGVILVLPATPLRTLGLALVVAKLLTATAFLARSAAFRTALIDHALALAAVLALQGAAWWSRDAASAPWIVAGVVVAVVAGAIQGLRIAPHPRFNHNDLYHVVQIGALWLLYRGGLLLGTG